MNAYTYGRDNPVALLDTSGWDSAYFAAKSVGNGLTWGTIFSPQTYAGLLGGEHNYVYFNIDSPAGLNKLDIPGVSVQGGQTNFTISFEPSNPQAPANSNLVVQLNADLDDAKRYNGSAGHQDMDSENYADLANEMFVLSSIISSEKKKYNFWPGCGRGMDIIQIVVYSQ